MHYQFFCEKCNKYIRVPILWGKTLAKMAEQHQCKVLTSGKGRGKNTPQGNLASQKHGSEG